METRAERGLQLLKDAELADITFIVGPEKIPIKANKSILRLASGVFYKMFALGEKEQNAYEVPDMEVEEFMVLLEYFYTGIFEAEKIEDNWRMLRGSTLYGAVDVKDYCMKQLMESICYENCAQILELALELENEELEDFALVYICKAKYAGQIFNNQNLIIANFTEKHLLKILPLDELAVDELELFNSLVSWSKLELLKSYPAETADSENSASNHSTNPKYLRTILENIIPLIRFPLIKPSDFATQVEPTGILTVEEVNAVLLYFMVEESQKASYEAKIFSTKPRALSAAAAAAAQKAAKEIKETPPPLPDDTYLYGKCMCSRDPSGNNSKYFGRRVGIANRKYGIVCCTCFKPF